MAKASRSKTLRRNLTDAPGSSSTQPEAIATHIRSTPDAEGDTGSGGVPDGGQPLLDDTDNPHKRPEHEKEELSTSTILKIIHGYREEAHEARKTRLQKNKKNQMAYMDEQDFSHKQPGQSAEFLPKVSVSAEQFSAFIKRSLVQFGQWYDIKLNGDLPPFITDKNIQELMDLYLHNIPMGTMKTIKFESVISDAGKQALFDSLIILKIHGKPVTRNKYHAEKDTHIDLDTGETSQGDATLKVEKQSTWRLCVDIVRAEDYYPDPTGRGLYEIHEVERDYYEVLAMAEAGIYDIAVVEAIKEDFRRKEEDVRKPVTKGHDRAEPPGFRRKIVITECWGTILDEDGYAAYENVVCAVANDKYVIRKPEPNPFWHGESPFVVAPLIRVPQSVWHKALYDTASDLNIALNEMFNLMLDGGLASVWGIKQLRASYLTDPSQVSDGVPQGVTLLVNENLPAGEKVVETVSQGSIPQDAMAIFEMLNREFTQAALTNDIKLGSLPPRQVKATEITSADQSQAVTLDSIAADMENDVMEVALRKCWLTILQHIEDFDQQEIIQCIGPDAAHWLINQSPAERFAMFANIATFTVSGLSSMLSRVRDFQKTAALLQMVGASPALMQAFMKDYSFSKVLKQAMKQLNINPDDLALTPDEKASLPQTMQQMMLLGEMMGITPPNAAQAQDGSGGQGAAAPPPGAAEGTAQVHQEANPTTGMRLQ